MAVQALTPAPGKQSQTELFEFEASPVYLARPCLKIRISKLVWARYGKYAKAILLSILETKTEESRIQGNLRYHKTLKIKTNKTKKREGGARGLAQ